MDIVQKQTKAVQTERHLLYHCKRSQREYFIHTLSKNGINLCFVDDVTLNMQNSTLQKYSPHLHRNQEFKEVFKNTLKIRHKNTFKIFSSSSDATISKETT